MTEVARRLRSASGCSCSTIVAGLFGEQTALSNFAPTFVYVIFWVGLVPASILLGDVFRAFNPWRAIARAVGVRRLPGRRPAAEAVRRTRAWLGRWPAAATILGFAWMELAYIDSDDPSTLAIATLVYTAMTLVAISVYGTEAWIAQRRGLLRLLQPLLAHLAGGGAGTGRLGLRRPLAGACRGSTPLPGTVALLIVMLGTVTFDGASEGPLWADAGPWLQDRFSRHRLQPRHRRRALVHDRDRWPAWR